jgi:Ca2+/Na+ antiporter
MGGLSDLFPEPESMTTASLVFMMLVYGYILFNASKIIASGSEMLLLLFGAGIVGGLVIPILGAVPDCAIILISGLGSGDKDSIQDELRVGVGTLVGSTVMLLTVPFGSGILMGRRDWDEQRGEAAITPSKRPKYTSFTWTNTCVTVLSEIPATAKVMMCTSLLYWVIQLPAFYYQSHSDASSDESPYALAGFILTSLGFCGYCYLQLTSARQADLDKRLQAAVRRKEWKEGLDSRWGYDMHQENIFRQYDRDGNGFMDAAELKDALAEMGLKCDRREIAEIIKLIDQEGESGKPDGKISLAEFKAACNTWVREGGIPSSPQGSTQPNASARKTFEREFVRRSSQLEKKLERKETKDLKELTKGREDDDTTPLLGQGKSGYGAVGTEGSLQETTKEKPPKGKDKAGKDKAGKDKAGKDGAGKDGAGDATADDDADPDDEEEAEEEMWELTDSQLKVKAFTLLAIGTVLVSIFSDPMVDVINKLGDKMGVSPFYVSFVVTPLASNASEVISGVIFARKKTVESVSLCFASLLGAACMNNTLALCIFMALVYFRELSWSFSAEIVSLIVVVIVVGINALRRNYFMWQAIIIIAMYPICLCLVAGLEAAGLD